MTNDNDYTKARRDLLAEVNAIRCRENKPPITSAELERRLSRLREICNTTPILLEHSDV